jgi:phospholipase C
MALFVALCTERQMDLRDTPSDDAPWSSDADYDYTAAGGDPSDTSFRSRREFLKLSAAVASSSLLGACIGQDPSRTRVFRGGAPFSTFDHIVVVMFENRSLDSLLGYLYTPGTIPRNQTFNGLAGAEHRCPVPPYINDGHAYVSARISPGTDADMMNPNPDPGEEYQHVNTQLYSIVDPPDNAFRTAGLMVAPWNNPAPGQTPTMDGFVRDYCNKFVATKKRHPTFDEYRVIMDSFSPEQLPVLSTLAQQFAVYDAWHCSVPTQTLPNRVFFHASTSSGYTVNLPYTKWLTRNAQPTIFNRLYDAGRTWRVYYDETQIVPMTALIHAQMLFPYWLTHFATMKTFYSDVANGTLPDYAFVEPRMIFNNSDYHPPAPSIIHQGTTHGGISDVRAGDLLAHQIYTAVRTSNAATGSNALNTLLLLTFDEHGGCFDHAVPPSALPPDDNKPEGEKGFFFDRMGLRVPTIAISAYTETNTVVNRTVHHGALLRTLCMKYNLPHLTERDRTAPDLADAINLRTPRHPSTWPVTVPRPVPPEVSETDPLAAGLAPRPLNDLERSHVGLSMAQFKGVEPAQEEIPQTQAEAYVLLKQLAEGKFRK